MLTQDTFETRISRVCAGVFVERYMISYVHVGE